MGGTVTKHLRAAILCLALLAPLQNVPTCAAQQQKLAPPAPVPVQILMAKKVFVANGGGDESRDELASYTGGPDRAYNEFYAAMKSWGRYELVAAPMDADLILEIQLTVYQPQHEHLMADNDAAYDAQLRFVVRDVKTHQRLWGLTEHVQTAVLQSNRDKNFQQALAAIIAEAKRIAGPEAAAPAKN